MNATIDLAQLLGAIGAIFAALGAAFAWLWRAVSAWRRDIEATVAECKAHHEVSNHHRQSQAGVIRFLIDAWRLSDPHNPLLAQAEAMLDEMERQASEMMARLGIGPKSPSKDGD